MKNLLAPIALVVLLFGGVFTACDNTIDVTAPYRDTTIVYALLNQNDAVHYIKVNKSYLGDGNALIMAGVADSVNYGANDIDVRLLAINPTTGAVIQTIPLTRTVNEVVKDSGLFANDANILYRTNATLNPANRYRVEIEKFSNGTIVSGETALLQNLTVQNPPNNGVQYSVLGPNAQNNPFVRYTTGANGKVYNVVIRFNFTEINTQTNDTTRRFVDLTLQQYVALNLNGGESVTQTFTKDQFYQNIAANVAPIQQNVIRKIGRLEFLFYVGANDLYTYIEVNEPSNTLQQEKPEFTNVTNGLGLISARYTTVRNNISLSGPSIDSLLNGRFTSNLGFQQ